MKAVETKLINLGFQIIAISPDRPEKLNAAIVKNEFKYQLLSDNDMVAAKSLGIAYRVTDEMLKTFKSYGIDIEADSGRDHHLLPVPAAFIVTRDGIIRFSYVNPDYKVRIDPDLLFEAAKASLK